MLRALATKSLKRFWRNEGQCSVQVFTCGFDDKFLLVALMTHSVPYVQFLFVEELSRQPPEEATLITRRLRVGESNVEVI